MASHIPIWLIGFSLLSFNSLAQTVIAPTYEALTNAAASGGNFQFSGPGTIVIPSPVAFSSTTTLDGNGHQVLLSGNSQSSIIQLGTNTALTLKGLSFVNGRAEGSAAPGNVRPGNGGAIVNLGGSLTIQSCTFSNNIAKGAPNPPGGPVGDGPLPVDPPACNAAGGAIWQLGGSLVIEDTSFLTNSAASTLASPGEANGGAIYIKDADEFQLSNVKFTSNTVALQSGGSFSAGHFESVPARGGAVYSENTDLTFAGGELINSTAANHTGPSYGGGIFATNATVVVSELLASNNFALGGTIGDRVANRGMPALGGALHVIGTTRISNSAFLTNSVRGGLARFTPPATGRGGAIYSQGELSIPGQRAPA